MATKETLMRKPTAGNVVAKMKANDLRRLVLAIHETMWTDGPNTEWSAGDTIDAVSTLLQNFGLGPQVAGKRDRR